MHLILAPAEGWWPSATWESPPNASLTMMFEVYVENVIEDQCNSSSFHLDGPPVLTHVEG